MVERFVEINVRVFLDGTLTSRRGFQFTGTGTRETLGFPGNLHVFTEGLSFFLTLRAPHPQHPESRKAYEAKR